jgi:hypothetical protein
MIGQRSYEPRRIGKTPMILPLASVSRNVSGSRRSSSRLRAVPGAKPQPQAAVIMRARPSPFEYLGVVSNVVFGIFLRWRLFAVGWLGRGGAGKWHAPSPKTHRATGFGAPSAGLHDSISA